MVDVHGNAVDAWLTRAMVSKNSRGLLRAFEAAISSIWARAARTLGTVTLAAVADRVLSNAMERYAWLSALEPLPEGRFRCDELRLEARLAGVPYSDLVVGVRSILIELVGLLGSLTANIITPDLHAELARMPARELEGRSHLLAIGAAT